MANKLGVAKDNFFHSASNVYYKKGKPYRVDDRDPFFARHFVFSNQEVEKALEKSEQASD